MDYLERKFGKYAIHNLMKLIAFGMAAVYIMSFISDKFIYNLAFSWELVKSGQVWRIITFIFVPESRGFFAIFYFLILIFFGDIIERYYGAFKLNLYVLAGCIGTIIANIIIEKMTGVAIPITNSYLYLSLMLLVATIAPDFELRLYFFIPVKLKYLAIVYAGLTLFSFFTGNILVKIVIGFSFINYLIFAGVYLFRKQKSFVRKTQYNMKTKQTAKKTQVKPSSKIVEVAFHCCEVCGKTEKDDPSLEFRYCSKCDGMHEYCNNHIRNHEHIKGDN